MISHYIKIAFRHMLKNKTFSAINILGLSIAIGCCVLLTLFVQDEMSYDLHFKDADRIYRLTTTMKTPNGRESKLQRASPPIGPALLVAYPEIEAMTRVVKDLSAVEQMLTYKDQTFFEKRGYQVDSNFFEVFPYEFIEGNPTTALKYPRSVVLSEELAHKIFGNKSALNELIAVPTKSEGTFKVTGVIKNTNLKSHLDADFYMSGLEQVLQPFTTWATDNFVFTYLKIKKQNNVQDLIAKFPRLMQRYGEKENQAMGRKKTLGLQPLSAVHLHSRQFDNAIELGNSGSIIYIYVTTAIGILILVLASINFINLTTAKASQRANEIGIRKAVGARRITLFFQFIGESMGIAFTATIFSAALIYLTLPWFNEAIQKDLHINFQNFLFVAKVMGTFALITGLTAGIYPALVLSSPEAARILKEKKLRTRGFNIVRKGLITFQFSISMILIACIIVIQHQLNFIQSKPLGFETIYKVMMPLRTAEAARHYSEFKNEIKSIAGVEEVTATSNSPSTPPINDWNFYPTGKNENDAVAHYIIYVDENYFKLMSIPRIEGRDFSFPSDVLNPFSSATRKIMVNRASLLKMGIDPALAVGTKLLSARDNVSSEIVGVVEDFHQFSLHEAISPLIFYASADSSLFHQAIITLNAQASATTLSKVEDVWRHLIPDTPFEYDTLYDSVQRQYADDKRISSIINYSTFLAIIISCMGLYGLSIFVTESRTKEIGIRKVLGSTTGGIVILLSKEFLQILLISFIVGTPISYFISHEWLQNFAYRIDLDPSSFLTAGVIGFLVVMIAVSFESFKAAKANPVKSLRSE